MTDRKVAVVTGSAGALGASMCAELSAAGHVVIGVDQKPSDAVVARHIDCDLTDIAALQAMFDEVLAAFGPVRVLCNNAGVYKPTVLMDLTVAEFDLFFDVNVRAVFFGTQFAARQMIAAGKGGCIINTASIAGQALGSPAPHYGASKAAVISFTKSAGRELAKHNIRVNAIAPGTIRSAMSASMTEERRQELFAKLPLGRAGEPHEIGKVAAFLASDAASYITGSVIDVNGGL